MVEDFEVTDGHSIILNVNLCLRDCLRESLYLPIPTYLLIAKVTHKFASEVQNAYFCQSKSTKFEFTLVNYRVLSYYITLFEGINRNSVLILIHYLNVNDPVDNKYQAAAVVANFDNIGAWIVYCMLHVKLNLLNESLLSWFWENSVKVLNLIEQYRFELDPLVIIVVQGPFFDGVIHHRRKSTHLFKMFFLKQCQCTIIFAFNIGRANRPKN